MKREVWREMSLRARAQWVLQYYGAAIVVSILALIAAVSFFTSAFGPGEHYAVKVMILDDRQTADNCRLFSDALGAALGGECEITCYAPSATYEMQAFAVRLTSDKLDVIIAPREQARELLSNGYLREIEPLPADSRYQAVTRGGEDDGDIFIGIAARSANADNAAAAARYFIETDPSISTTEES